MPRERRTLRAACALALGALVLSLTPLVAPAQAITSGYLCTGYAACKDAGYGHAGYAANNGKMYWRMYAGHNCTNYVAYRMVKAGMPNVRPWSGGGNAHFWGLEMSKITDQQPRVGAVAWWKANVPGAGSSGHVAYVERVISPTEIVISEDSWGGNFHWRKITKSGSWPSGFIHFVDKAIDNITMPTVTGTPQVGVPLTATPGEWKPVATVRYRWLADGTPIPGATAATFTPAAEHRRSVVSVRVKATRKGFTPSTITLQTSGPVVAGELTSVETPAVVGDPFVDETLTATPGAWSPAPTETRFRWRADGELIEGADGPTLQVTRDLVGKKVKAVAEVRREGYVTAVAKSAPTAPVLLGRIDVGEPFNAGGRARVGSRMWIEPGTFTPSDATLGYSWLRNGVPIEGATGPSYDVATADAGARITALVTLTKTHYAPRVLHFAMGDRVTTKPELRVTTTGRSGRAVVVVKVVAPGVAGPGGRVTVRIGKQKETMRVVDGRARVVVDGLPPQRRKVYVVYSGTPVVEPARETAYVRVRR